MDQDLKAIARATGAHSWRIVDGEIELWKPGIGGQQVGRIEGNRVVWKQTSRPYPPENTDRL